MLQSQSANSTSHPHAQADAAPVYMRRSEFARHMGVGKSYITALGNQGRLVLRDGDNGLIDVERTKALLRSTTAAPERAAPASTTPTFVEQKERGEQYKADLLEIELAERRGELLPLADVRAAVAGAAVVLRNTLEGLPHRLAPQLAAAADENAVRVLLSDEIEAVLSDLQHAIAELGKTKT